MAEAAGPGDPGSEAPAPAAGPTGPGSEPAVRGAVPPGPVEALERIAYLLELLGEASFKVRAFRSAARSLRALAPGDLESITAGGRLTSLAGIGETSARVVRESLAGTTPSYLARLEDEAAAARPALDRDVAAMLEALRGDCHSHSDWSDG
ncbi:MAG TPA: hypothetical protein VMD59_11200, partial [Acidimicrobiales bacterium]|nr:hypothetical protein [Acidimicrobiales bacterium]